MESNERCVPRWPAPGLVEGKTANEVLGDRPPFKARAVVIKDKEVLASDNLPPLPPVLAAFPNPLEELSLLYEEAKAIMMRKNHDYSGGSGDPYANFRGSAFLGIDPILGIMLRMQDKMMRIKTFVEKGTLKVQGEGVRDSLLDLVNYTALIAGMVKEKMDEV